MWIKQQRFFPTVRERNELCGEVVQRIPKRPIGGLARLAVGEDVPGARVLDRCRVCGERPNAAARREWTLGDVRPSE